MYLHAHHLFNQPTVQPNGAICSEWNLRVLCSVITPVEAQITAEFDRHHIQAGCKTAGMIEWMILPH